MARGKEHQGNLGSMAEAFQRMVHEEKARLDPDYSGDNPKTPREAKRDMEKLGIVKEPSKGKKRQARTQPQATSVSDDRELAEPNAEPVLKQAAVPAETASTDESKETKTAQLDHLSELRLYALALGLNAKEELSEDDLQKQIDAKVVEIKKEAESLFLFEDSDNPAEINLALQTAKDVAKRDRERFEGETLTLADIKHWPEYIARSDRIYQLDAAMRNALGAGAKWDRVRLQTALKDIVKLEKSATRAVNVAERKAANRAAGKKEPKPEPPPPRTREHRPPVKPIAPAAAIERRILVGTDEKGEPVYLDAKTKVKPPAKVTALVESGQMTGNDITLLRNQLRIPYDRDFRQRIAERIRDHYLGRGDDGKQTLSRFYSNPETQKIFSELGLRVPEEITAPLDRVKRLEEMTITERYRARHANFQDLKRMVNQKDLSSEQQRAAATLVVSELKRFLGKKDLEEDNRKRITAEIAKWKIILERKEWEEKQEQKKAARDSAQQRQKPFWAVINNKKSTPAQRLRAIEDMPDVPIMSKILQQKLLMIRVNNIMWSVERAGVAEKLKGLDEAEKFAAQASVIGGDNAAAQLAKVRKSQLDWPDMFLENNKLRLTDRLLAVQYLIPKLEELVKQADKEKAKQAEKRLADAKKVEAQLLKVQQELEKKAVVKAPTRAADEPVPEPLKPAPEPAAQEPADLRVTEPVVNPILNISATAPESRRASPGEAGRESPEQKEARVRVFAERLFDNAYADDLRKQGYTESKINKHIKHQTQDELFMEQREKGIKALVDVFKDRI